MAAPSRSDAGPGALPYPDGLREPADDPSRTIASARPRRGDDDGALIAASLDDPTRFAEIFDRHWPTIFRYCLARAGEPGEDVAAETFRVAFDQRDRFDVSRSSARPWLYGIATNLLRHHHRRAGRAGRAVVRLFNRADASPPPEERMVDRAAAAAARGPLFEAVMALRPAERDVVLLNAWADLTYQEIADALELPIGTVRSRLSRARRTLRAELEDLR